MSLRFGAYPQHMATTPTDALTKAALSETERRVLSRIVALLKAEFGGDLLAVWLYGSRARGERTHPDSDVDLLVIARGDTHRNQRVAGDLGEAAALADGESPFAYSVHVYDPQWLRGRREIESFFIQEVDRDKIVLAGSDLEGGDAP